ncbi:MAG: hypothetical protein WD023_02240 [Ilumatobacteraceae bacterium]
MEPVYDAVWPKSPLGARSRPPAARLDALQGKRIAFAWDHLFRGDELFPVLAAELQRRFEGIEIVGYETFGNLHGPDEHRLVEGLPAALAMHRIDGVVSGNGC